MNNTIGEIVSTTRGQDKLMSMVIFWSKTRIVIIPFIGVAKNVKHCDAMAEQLLD